MSALERYKELVVLGFLTSDASAAWWAQVMDADREMTSDERDAAADWRAENGYLIFYPESNE